MAFEAVSVTGTTSPSPGPETGPFVITEQTGTSPLKLTLGGGCGPMKPIDFEGTTRSEVTWYAGNDVGSLQMQGGRLSPTHIHGHWSSRWLNTFDESSAKDAAGNTFNTIQDLVNYADLIRRRGQQVKVTWNDKIRYGILHRFRESWIHNDDVYWEMEFIWQKDGVPQVWTSQVKKPNPGDISANVSARVDQVQEVPDLASIQLPSLLGWYTAFINRAAGIVGKIEGVRNTIEDSVTSAIDQALLPFQLSKSMVANLGEMVATAKDLVDYAESNAFETALEVTGIPSDVIALGGAAVSDFISTQEELQSGFFAGLLGVAQQQRQLVLAAKQLERECIQGILDLSQETDPSILSVYRCKSGDNLRTVSRFFYGADSYWLQLKAYNQLPDSTLVPGQVLYIPTDPSSVFQGSWN